MILTRDGIAWRIARDLHEGAYVNLGVGIPVLVSNYLDRTQEIFLHSENGILGVGPVPKGDDIDLDLISAGKGFCTLALGAAIFDQQISFAMMRGGHLTHAVLGAIEVAQNGDFANWKVPGEAVPGVGGAMDLAVGAPNILIAMSHVTNKGKPKIVKTCTAPLTARRCVKRIYTDIAIVDVTADGLVLREAMPGFDPAAVQAKTEAVLIVAPDFREMEVPETAANGAKLQQ
ncbi:MAG: 3-oxoacid CoA-transferase subunit B [Proteobacteria bacterium]|jgi:3-oxoacid CoA-transferase B subunit|nr:3-oxoacid CoA-transferase subunit B [Pseudomonadota bacterium]